MVDALAPYEAGRYFNFAEEKTDVASVYSPRTLERLRAVKRTVDPFDLFHANHQIGVK